MNFRKMVLPEDTKANNKKDNKHTKENIRLAREYMNNNPNRAMEYLETTNPGEDRYYRFLINHYKSIVSFYTSAADRMKKGEEALEYVLLDNPNKWPAKYTKAQVNECIGYKSFAFANMRYYAKKLNTERDIHINIPMPHIPESPLPRRWNPMNPAIIKHGDDIIIAIRLVNYERIGLTFYIFHPDLKIRSNITLYKIPLSDLLSQENKGKMEITSCARIKNNYMHIEGEHFGLEDPRIYYHPDGDIRLLCCAADIQPSLKGQMCLLNLGNPSLFFAQMDEHPYREITAGKSIKSVPEIVYDVKQMPGPDEQRTEKNWIPVDNLFIYKMSDREIRDDDGDVIARIPETRSLGRWHGSSPAIEYTFKGQKGKLMIVHEIDNENNYFHRFIFLTGSDYNPAAFSKPFYFQEIQIEFCSSIIQISEESYLISYGVKDKESHISQVSKQTIDQMLE